MILKSKLLACLYAYFLLPVGVCYAAANLNGVTVTKLNINKSLGNLLFIRTSLPPTVVGCQTDRNWNLVLQLDTALDNKIYAGLLAAQASQISVDLAGTGTCNSLGIEYLNNFTITK